MRVILFSHQTLMIWNGGSKGTKTPFHTEVLPLSRKDDEIDDNDGDDSVANVPLKFQGLEHDDSISKWKN